MSLTLQVLNRYLLLITVAVISVGCDSYARTPQRAPPSSWHAADVSKPPTTSGPSHSEYIGTKTQMDIEVGSQLRSDTPEAKSPNQAGESRAAKSQMPTTEEVESRRERLRQFTTSATRDDVPTVCESLNDPEAIVRIWAVSALGRLRSDESVSKMLPLLCDADANVRFHTARTLLGMGDCETIAVVAKGKDRRLLINVIRYAGELHNQNAIQYLAPLIQSPDIVVSGSALQSVAYIDGVSAQPRVDGDRMEELRSWWNSIGAKKYAGKLR